MSDTAIGPRVRVVGTSGRVRVVLPTRRDARLHVAIVLVSVQILGQATLRFELSIAQILISVGTCAVLEIGLTFWQRRMIVWPASGLLTGNGVALILRVAGTRHGDWWSLRGAPIFAGVAAASLLSKYVIRIRGRQVFNPSNIGLLAGFVILGSQRVNPLDLWWGPLDAGLAVTYTVIVVGGLLIVTRLRMLAMAVSFWLTFAASIGVLALRGHCISTRWHVGPVCGAYFWWVLVTSPEILVFLFFMITDPKTAPGGRNARIMFGAGVGFVAALLAAPARSEFTTKVAVLAALAVLCVLRPVIERGLAGPQRRLAQRSRRPAVVLTVASFAVAALIPLGARAQPTSPARVGEIFGSPARPSDLVDQQALPPVDIDGSVAQVDVTVTSTIASRMRDDLLADLELEARALAQRDIALAASAATGRALDELRDALNSPDPGASIVRYSFDRLTVTVLKDSTRPQAPPILALLARGTIQHGTAEARSSFDGTFGLALVGGHYLIASQMPG